MPNFTISEENYIKSVYYLQQENSVVNTNALARQLKTTAASVTDMLKKLCNKKIIHYKPYRGFYLSKEGAAVALSIIRKHRLWECFLVNTLHFNWEEVHEVAEQLEHVTSTKLINKLDAFLNYPQFDPHGDPIPNSNGKVYLQNQLKLAELPVSKPAVVTSVISQSSELLGFLTKSHITIGTKVEIKRKFSFDNSVEVRIKNKTSHISEQIAKSINVKPL